MGIIKNRTYNNFLRGMKIIQNKGYTEKEAENITRNIFDEMDKLKNGMSFNWYAGKIINKQSERVFEN